MLRTSAGVGVDAPLLAPHPTVHQLTSRLDLRFEADAGRTRMHADSQEPPWRVVRAFAQDNGGCLVHLHNVSGGVLSGDHLSLSVRLAPASIAQITTTSATRLYRHRHGLPDSQQLVDIHVGEGAVLEYLPDALIPFAGSRHSQRTSVILEDGAVMLWWEVLAPGRQAMGEAFAYDSLRIETEVRTPQRPLLIEKADLDPKARSLRSLARIGPYTYSANFYAFSVGLRSSQWSELEEKLNDFCRARSSPGAMIWGTSTLAAHGIAVRGLSHSARELPATLAAIWNIAKRFLTGEDAVLPRKVH